VDPVQLGAGFDEEFMTRHVALITGATGQDGAGHVSPEEGIIHGIERRSSSFNTGRIDHLYQDPHDAALRFILQYGYMTNSTHLLVRTGHAT
jgi:GDPmannose 4,6-dehydratase